MSTQQSKWAALSIPFWFFIQSFVFSVSVAQSFARRKMSWVRREHWAKHCSHWRPFVHLAGEVESLALVVQAHMFMAGHPAPPFVHQMTFDHLWSTTIAIMAVLIRRFTVCTYVSIYWWDRLDHVGSKREDGFHKSWLVGQQAWCNWRAAWNLVACCGDKSICCLELNPRGSMRWHKPQSCLSHSNRVCDILDSLCRPQFHSRHCLISTCDFQPCSQHLAYRIVFLFARELHCTASMAALKLSPMVSKMEEFLAQTRRKCFKRQSQTIAQDCPDNRICESLQNPGHTQSQFSARLASKLLPAFHLILTSIRIELQCRCQTWKAVGRKWMALFALLSRDYATLHLPMSTFAKSHHNRYL